MAKLEDRRFDLRTLERNIRNGVITQKEYDEYIASLKDASENAEKMESAFEVGVLAEDDKKS